MLTLTRDSWAEVLSSAKPVVVDVWGPNCAPCLRLIPLFERLAAENEGAVLAAKLDASGNRRLCIELKVFGLPTYLRFEGGVEVARISGDAAAPSALERLFGGTTQEEVDGRAER